MYAKLVRHMAVNPTNSLIILIILFQLKKRARGDRSRGSNSNEPGTHNMEESVIASSDDEDSYGSQERDLGDHIRRG